MHSRSSPFVEWPGGRDVWGSRLLWHRAALRRAGQLLGLLLVALTVHLLIPGRVAVEVTVIGPSSLHLELERYVAGVVAAEMPASFAMGALEAQAVAARTYAVYHHDRLANSTASQLYVTRALLRQRWGRSYAANWRRVVMATLATRGEILVYGGRPILAVYCAAAGPYSESAHEAFGMSLAYLPEHRDPYDEGSPAYSTALSMPDAQLVKDLGGLPRAFRRDAAGHVLWVRLFGGRRLSGRAVAQRLGLPSTAFGMRAVGGGRYRIQTFGAGHGVGLDQWGAQGMARIGKSYRQILAFYYPSSTLVRIGD